MQKADAPSSEREVKRDSNAFHRAFSHISVKSQRAARLTHINIPRMHLQIFESVGLYNHFIIHERRARSFYTVYLTAVPSGSISFHETVKADCVLATCIAIVIASPKLHKIDMKEGADLAEREKFIYHKILH